MGSLWARLFRDIWDLFNLGQFDPIKGSFKKYVFKWGGGGVLKNDTECHRGEGGVLEFNT